MRAPASSSLRLPRLRALTLLRASPAPGHISLPDVCCDVIWAGGKLFLGGPMTRSEPLNTEASPLNGVREIEILRIDPSVARAWLGVPLDRLVDQTIPLADIDKDRADEILALCETDQLALVMTAGPAPQVEGRDLRLAAAAQALRRGATVRAAAATAGWSERQFERQFAAALGVSPKIFARIVRFRRAVFAAKGGASLAEAAALGGYFDQAHFSRDVRAFTGASPRALLPNVGKVQDVAAGAL